jgi:hypothetical protein
MINQGGTGSEIEFYTYNIRLLSYGTCANTLFYKEEVYNIGYIIPILVNIA